MITTNRVRLLFIRPEHILAVFCPHHQYLQYLRIEEIPEDARIESVNFDFARRCFVLAVTHESFDEVKPELPIPSHPVTPVVCEAVNAIAIRKALHPLRERLFPNELVARHLEPDSYDMGLFDAIKPVWDLLPPETVTLTQGPASTSTGG